jgi:peroxiredoxin
MSKSSSIDIVRLANTPVLTARGEKLRLGQIWQKQTVILVFLRHFACIGCRAHAVQVWNDREKYESSGGKIIFVGNGQPHFIEKFQEDLGITGAVILTDPSLESFRAAGFRRGFFAVVQPKSVLNAAKLAVEGHRQTAYSKEVGTHWQLGGVLVVNTHGKVLYQFLSESLGDFPQEPHFEQIISDEEKSQPA